MLQTQIVISIIILLVVIFYLFNFSKLPCKQKSLLNKIDILIITSLTAIYSTISFTHFASFYKYQNNLELTSPNQTVTITLNDQKPLKAFYYATGYLKGSYAISMLDQNNKNIIIDDKDEKLGYPPYFRWNMIDLTNKKTPHTIIITLTSGILDLSQVLLIDMTNKIINNYQIHTNFNTKTMNLQNLKSSYLPGNDDNYVTSTVFDEIYYATSAYQYLTNTSPDVWVHPQLGVLSILVGICIFGVSSLGWRVIPAIATILLLPLMYIFAKRIFEKPKIAIIAMVLLMCEFMHFVLGRIGSLEPFVTLFLFLEYYYLYRYIDNRVNGISYKIASRNLLYAGIYWGLAISSKWNALYSALMIIMSIIYVELIRNKSSISRIPQKFIHSILQFVLIPLLIYVLVYIPYAYINNYSNLWQSVDQLQHGMLDFNLGLIHATHPYASRFWSWPLDFKPLSVYFWQKGAMSSSIVIMGNPLIFWSFIPVTLFLMYMVIHDKKDYRALFLLGSMLSLYLPYALVSRISFIYYFYSITPFLILSICYAINKMLAIQKTWVPVVVYSYIGITVLLFILFYPALAGIEFWRTYVTHALLWFATWNF